MRPNSIVSSTAHYESPRSSIASSGNGQQSVLRNRGTKHISQKDWEERRKIGLCFRCAQSYSPQHHCPEGKLRLLLADDDVNEDGEIVLAEAETGEEEDEVQKRGECQSLELFGLSEIKNQNNEV